MYVKKQIILLFFLSLVTISCKHDWPENSVSAHEKEKNNKVQFITDMRGEEVAVPQNINRVVTISDGFVASVMFFLGEEKKIVGLGSRCVQNNFSYDYTSAEGNTLRYKNGMNPIRFLHPELKELPLIAASNLALNYETLASLRPDVVILRAGSCTFGGLEDENTQKTIRTMDAIGIPLIVLKGPPCYDQPTLSFITEEIQLVGKLFHKEEETRQLASFLEEQALEIQERTKNIPEEEKKRMLLLGLSPRIRASGGAGNTKGNDTIESFFIESFANAENVYEGIGGRAGYVVLSAEQIYALDPDIVLLPTSSGYHPASELYLAPYFKNLQALRAVKEREVYALPWTPCNCAKRLEYPIEMMIMAKAANPDHFQDIKVHKWVLDFYQQAYGIDKPMAEQLRAVQWLDWMVDHDF